MKNFAGIFYVILKIILGIIFGLFLSLVTIVGLENILPDPNPFRKETVSLWLIAPIIAGWLFLMLWLMLRKWSSGKIETQGIDHLPESVSELIDAIIEAMRYRKSIRTEVRQELTDHFTDALADCTNEQEKQERIITLIDEFGDPKLLGTLLRRAKKRCRPLWRILVVRAFQLVSICLFLLVCHFVYLSFAEPVIRVNYLKEITQLSQTVTDNNKNAAVWYQKAIDAYQPPETIFDTETANHLSKILRSDVWINELTNEQSLQLDQWYQANTQSYTYLLKGNKLSNCWWEYDNQKTQTLYSMEIPKYHNLRELLLLSCWNAKKEASIGNYQKAFHSLQETYLFGMHFKGPRTLIEQLVGISMENYAAKTARQIIAHCSIPLNNLSSFRESLLKLIHNDVFIADLETEKLGFLDFIQRMYTDNGRGQGVLIPRQMVELNREFDFFDALEVPGISEGVSYGASIISADRKHMTQEAERLYDLLNNYIRQTPFAIHEKGYAEPLDKLWDHSTLYRYRYWPIFMFTPAISRVGQLMYQNHCEIQATTAILAILQDKEQHGQLPDSLERLVQEGLLPNVPLDPFSDKPLIYRKTDDGFTLYSVGLNFTDNSGQPATDENKKPTRWGENGDAVFWPVMDH